MFWKIAKVIAGGDAGMGRGDAAGAAGNQAARTDGKKQSMSASAAHPLLR